MVDTKKSELIAVHATTTHGVRKCVRCGKEIDIGEKSVDMTTMNNGNFVTGHHCEDCSHEYE